MRFLLGLMAVVGGVALIARDGGEDAVPAAVSPIEVRQPTRASATDPPKSSTAVRAGAVTPPTAPARVDALDAGDGTAARTSSDRGTSTGDDGTSVLTDDDAAPTGTQSSEARVPSEPTDDEVATTPAAPTTGAGAAAESSDTSASDDSDDEAGGPGGVSTDADSSGADEESD